MNVLLSWAGPVFDMVINAFSLRGSLLFSGRGRSRMGSVPATAAV